MDPLHQIPLPEIAPHALLRDRTALEPSTPSNNSSTPSRPRASAPPSRSGSFSTPRDGHTYGLISGLRRLTACRALGMPHRSPPSSAPPETLAQALAADGDRERNPRTQISPWEKANLILNAVEEGHFDTPDAAIATLFSALPPHLPPAPARNHVQRGRGARPPPHRPRNASPPANLTASPPPSPPGTRIFSPPPCTPMPAQGAETQWSALRPVLLDILREPTNPHHPPPPPMLTLRQGLTIVTGASPGGYLLRFTGAQAKSGP
jgi:ParB family chromosome partitioning protein